MLSGLQLSELYTNDPEELENINTNINILIDQVIRGGSLISNVRKFSKLKEFEKNLKKIEVIESLKKIIELVKKYYQEVNNNIQINKHFNEFYILGNELLEDIFENLLINAIRHNKNKNKSLSYRCYLFF